MYVYATRVPDRRTHLERDRKVCGQQREKKRGERRGKKSRVEIGKKVSIPPNTDERTDGLAKAPAPAAAGSELNSVTDGEWKTQSFLSPHFRVKVAWCMDRSKRHLFNCTH